MSRLGCVFSAWLKGFILFLSNGMPLLWEGLGEIYWVYIERNYLELLQEKSQWNSSKMKKQVRAHMLPSHLSTNLVVWTCWVKGGSHSLLFWEHFCFHLLFLQSLLGEKSFCGYRHAVLFPFCMQKLGWFLYMLSSESTLFTWNSDHEFW